VLTRYVAAFEICDVIVLDGCEYLSFGSSDFLDGFFNVAVDHGGQLRVRYALPLDRAWLRQFGLSLFQPRGGGLSAVECPRRAIWCALGHSRVAQRTTPICAIVLLRTKAAFCLAYRTGGGCEYRARRASNDFSELIELASAPGPPCEHLVVAG
jgi:hypothetical protein